MHMTIEDMVVKARELGGSDIHLASGVPPKFRRDGLLENLDETPLNYGDCEEYAMELAKSRYNDIEFIL